jgi:hypothetical protein
MARFEPQPIKESSMVHLYDKDTGADLGAITEEQLKFLQDQLEEESEKDNDYYINLPEIQMLEENGADPVLLEVLLRGLYGREEMEVRWERSDDHHPRPGRSD